MGRWLTWKKGQGCLFLEVTLLGDESLDSAPILLAWCNGVMAWGGGGWAGAGHEPGHSSTHCLYMLGQATQSQPRREGRVSSSAEGPRHAVTGGGTCGGPLCGRRRMATTMTRIELLGPSPPRGSTSRWLR